MDYYQFTHLINHNILIINKEKLIVKTLIGITKRTINLSEILSYNEIEKENAKWKGEAGYMKWKDLTLFGKDFKFKISSSSYGNYAELKKSFNKRKEKKHKI